MPEDRYGLLGLKNQYDYSGNYQPDYNVDNTTKSAVYKAQNYMPNINTGSSDGLLNNGVNSDYINSNLQASAWNQNLGTATGLANLVNLGLNYGNQKKIAKNNIALQGQQIALNDANLKNLSGFRNNLASATDKVLGA